MITEQRIVGMYLRYFVSVLPISGWNWHLTPVTLPILAFCRPSANLSRRDRAKEWTGRLHLRAVSSETKSTSHPVSSKASSSCPLM